MNQKSKPLAAIRSAYSRGIVARLIFFAITVFAAVSFFHERSLLESQVWDLQDRLKTAEFDAEDAANALADAESSILSLEERLGDAESQLDGNVAYFELPMGYVEAQGYSGAELTLLSCAQVMVEHAAAADAYELGAAMVKYEAWDRKAVRDLLDSGKYELVGKASDTSGWNDSGDLFYYMLTEVRDRRGFDWSEKKKWNDAFWDWQNYMQRQCRLQT